MHGVPRLLVRGTCITFCGKRWLQSASVLAAIVKRYPASASSDDWALRNCCTELEDCVRPDSNSNSSSKGFKSSSIIQKLFDQLNWAVTEAASAISSLHDARKPLIEQLLASIEPPNVTDTSAATASATASLGASDGQAAEAEAEEDERDSADGEDYEEDEHEEDGEEEEDDEEAPGIEPASHPESPPINPNPIPTNPTNQRAAGSRPQIDESQVAKKIVNMLDNAKTLIRQVLSNSSVLTLVVCTYDALS